MMRTLILGAVSLIVVAGCHSQEDIPKLSESQNKLPPADSPLGKRVREGLAKRGQATPPPSTPSGN